MRKSKGVKLISMFLTGCLLMMGICGAAGREARV
jgi:hypothetical protein